MAVNCKQALSAYKKSTNFTLKTLFFSAGGAAPRTSAPAGGCATRGRTTQRDVRSWSMRVCLPAILSAHQ
eukprot:8314968-Pyramimonas_sp.AAC.1